MTSTSQAAGESASRWAAQSPDRNAPRLSILALGDTGEDAILGSHEETGQEIVANALVAEHRRLAAHVLLLLGDNFYDEGLRPEDLEERVALNLVHPYCPFVALGATRSPRLALACPGAPTTAHVRIMAVVGNHDIKQPESAWLEREGVASLVSNWWMPEGVASAVELGSGVSLIAVDSSAIRHGADLEPLREALRSSAGPWRVIAAHHPTRSARYSDYSIGSWKYHRRYAARLAEVVREVGVPVQLMLSGHDHWLAVIAGDDSMPLNVVAGSGSHIRHFDEREGYVFREEALGFARIDLMGSGDQQHLRVSLFETGVEASPASAPVWRARIDSTGAVRPLPTVAPSSRKPADLRGRHAARPAALRPARLRTRDGARGSDSARPTG